VGAWPKLQIAEPSVGFDSQELVNIEVSRWMACSWDGSLMLLCLYLGVLIWLEWVSGFPRLVGWSVDKDLQSSRSKRSIVANIDGQPCHGWLVVFKCHDAAMSG